jgi:hypothetical protein
MIFNFKDRSRAFPKINYPKSITLMSSNVIEERRPLLKKLSIIIQTNKLHLGSYKQPNFNRKVETNKWKL